MVIYKTKQNKFLREGQISSLVSETRTKLGRKKEDCSRSARMYILCTTGFQETQQTIILWLALLVWRSPVLSCESEIIQSSSERKIFQFLRFPVRNKVWLANSNIRVFLENSGETNKGENAPSKLQMYFISKIWHVTLWIGKKMYQNSVPSTALVRE